MPFKYKIFLCLILSVVCSFANAKKLDWKDNWSLENGFRIEIDSNGFSFPSDIAFIDNPGRDPKSPLYFVLELKGNIKVVSNDRTVSTFSEDILPIPLSDRFEQIGAVGICLEPKKGYVFVTFAYMDAIGEYRNGMVRFKSKPYEFGLKPESKLEFLELFEKERTDPPHQIGPCEIKGDKLFVAVGYGNEKHQAQNLDKTSSSILRMDLDFKPLSDNPFYSDDGVDMAIDYIWAYGFRNVFGLKFVGNRLFSSENGGSIDRFNEIRKGEDYLWNGTDWSIAAKADYVFSPSVGPVQLDFLPKDSELFPKAYRNKFYIPLAGNPGDGGIGANGERSVIFLEYDFEKNRLNDVPGHLLKWRGKGPQSPVSVAFGTDGLYVLPIFPDHTGVSSVLRVTYDPKVGHPHGFSEKNDPKTLISHYECRQCHKIDGHGGKVGPELNEAFFLKKKGRLYSEEYKAHIAKVDALDSEFYKKYQSERQAVLAATGQDKLSLWFKAYLQEPKFDNPNNIMPNPGMQKREAHIVASYLVHTKVKAENKQPTLYDYLRLAMARWIPALRYRHVLFAFALGIIVTVLIFTLVFVIFMLRNRYKAILR